MSISVAETLRQAADSCGGNPRGFVMTEACLRRLAHELEPNYRPPDPEIHAIGHSGFEAIGINGTWGYLHYLFIPRDSFDEFTWAKCYALAYHESRFPVPAIRPRSRVRAIGVRYTPYPLG